MRAVQYVYSPVSISQWWRSGFRRWWVRRRVHEHMPPVSLAGSAGAGLRIAHAAAVTLPHDFDREWLVAPEAYHADALFTWKADAPELRALCDSSARDRNAMETLNTGSSPAACWGGVAMPSTHAACHNLFWDRFVESFRLYRSANAECRDAEVAPKVADNMLRMASEFSHEERLQLELGLSRLTTALVARWAPVYYDESTTAGQSQSTTARLRAHLRKKCSDSDSFFVLHLLAQFVVGLGRPAVEEALNDPRESVFRFVQHPQLSLLTGAYLDMLVRPHTWRFHVRKMVLSEQVLLTKTAAERGLCRDVLRASPFADNVCQQLKKLRSAQRPRRRSFCLASCFFKIGSPVSSCKPRLDCAMMLASHASMWAALYGCLVSHSLHLVVAGEWSRLQTRIRQQPRKLCSCVVSRGEVKRRNCQPSSLRGRLR